MKQIHKKALLLVVFLAAMLIGTMLALYPVWKYRQEQREQEALLLRLEQQMKNVDVVSMKSFVDTKQLEATKVIQKEKVTDRKENRISFIIEETEIVPMLEAGAEIGILVIPKIEARLPVTAGVTEEQLNISEGWVMQTDFIGSEGNAVVAGHRSYTWGQHFNRLEELEAGDEIFFIGTGRKIMRFVVSEILTTEPDDPAVFAAPSAGMAQLTLYTCTPIRIATHRLIVRALLEE